MPKINDVGLALIKSCEGLSIIAYLDACNIWTIGYGHTGPDVYPGLRITPQRANELLQQDLAKFEKGVSDALEINATPNQFSAMVSFAYNVGLGAFRASTLLELFNLPASPDRVAAQFGRWVHGDSGEVLPGLVTRRAAEARLFLAP